MLGWLINWWKNRAREKSRAIFRYWDGKKERAIDPIVVFNRLDDDPVFVMERHARLIESKNEKEAREAIDVTAAAVCRAFQVSDYNEKAKEGLTVTERIDLLTEFLLYADTLKKNINTTPTLPQPTESQSSDTSTMNVTLGSGEMPVAPNCDTHVDL